MSDHEAHGHAVVEPAARDAPLAPSKEFVLERCSVEGQGEFVWYVVGRAAPGGRPSHMVGKDFD